MSFTVLPLLFGDGRRKLDNPAERGHYGKKPHRNHIWLTTHKRLFTGYRLCRIEREFRRTGGSNLAYDYDLGTIRNFPVPGARPSVVSADRCRCVRSGAGHQRRESNR